MAAALIPPKPTFVQLREMAAECKACDLWRCGTQTVFGTGPSHARMLLVGEQPGNDEDIAGKPFVGPAGRFLDRALEEAGIDRGETYMTNVVKHFKWEARGKRRIHAKPNTAEVTACLPWLRAEIDLVRPKLIVCLGATAAQALLGRTFRVTRQRGQIIEPPNSPAMLATVHPSSILRAPDAAKRREETVRFIADLQMARHYAGAGDL